MNWLKSHADAVIVLGGLLSSVLWMNMKFNELQRDIANLEKEVAIVKTVLIMKNMMPAELASQGKE